MKMLEADSSAIGNQRDWVSSFIITKFQNPLSTS
jgi:hypothetical protein